MCMTMKTKVVDATEQVRRRSRSGQDTSAEYEITDKHCISATGNLIAGNNLWEGGERDWHRLAEESQDMQTLK